MLNEKNKFYKYTKLEYVPGMLKDGVIRLGTLFEYRHYDEQEIQDADEGLGKRQKLVNQDIIFNQDTPLFYKQMMKGPDGKDLPHGTVIKIRDLSFEQTVQVMNCLIYCFTLNPNKADMLKFGYDACIEITDSKLFKLYTYMYLMAEDLLVPNIQLLEGNCTYTGRNFDYTDDDFTQIYWLKDKRFKHQAEYRIVYPTNIIDDSLAPKIISIPPLAQVFKYHTLT